MSINHLVAPWFRESRNKDAAISKSSPWFQTLSVVTAVLIYCLIVMGGIVRVTGSGLGCPDWPTCYGHLVPPPNVHSIIEYSHRSIAGLAGISILATAGFAWARYRSRPWIVLPATLMIGLLAVQIPLGGLIVATELEALLVAVHLGIALIIFASAITIAVASRRDTLPMTAYPADPELSLVLIALGALFIVLASGAVVVGSQASIACPDWPLCHGGLLPVLNASPLVAIHLIHRYFVVAMTCLIALVIIRTFRESTVSKRRWALLLGGLFIVQIAIGAVQVLLVLPALWRALHLMTAALIWAIVVTRAASGLMARQAMIASVRSDFPGDSLRDFNSTNQTGRVQL